MIRPVQLSDSEQIAQIFNDYILHSTAIFDEKPLSVDTMREHIAEISRTFPYYVYETAGVVKGFCYVHTWKQRPAYKATLETTIYLSKDIIGQGVGRELMNILINDCRKQGYKVLIACITAENEASVLFHEALGFSKVSHFHNVGYKFDRWLDVTDYELQL